MNHKQIQLLFDLWKKPYGKPVVGAILLLAVFVLLDYFYLSGENILYGSYPTGKPVSFTVNSPGVTYRIAVYIGNKKSKYSFTCRVKNPEGNIIADYQDSYTKNKRSFAFVPSQRGIYSLTAEPVYGGGPPSIMVSVYENNRSLLSHKFR